MHKQRFMQLEMNYSNQTSVYLNGLVRLSGELSAVYIVTLMGIYFIRLHCGCVADRSDKPRDI